VTPTFATVCSGIGAPEMAWHPLGWQCAFQSEIEPFPCEVPRHHYPDVPNYGDMTKFKEWPKHEGIDVICGGTPCQSFSVAGLRAGMDDPRGNLMLTYLAVAAKYRPRWLVWENVPGVLSSGEGRDFGSMLGGLAQLGYGWAYRILDAQYIRVDGHERAVPQRRRRVFVVGHLGDWRPAAAVLFERQSLQGNPAPSREARKRTTRSVAHCLRSGGNLRHREDCDTIVPVSSPLMCGSSHEAGHNARSGHGKDATLIPETCGTLKSCAKSGGWTNSADHAAAGYMIPGGLAHTLRAEHDASEDGTGRGVPLTLAVRGRGDGRNLETRQDGTANAVLTPNGGRDGIGVGAVAFAENQRGELRTSAAAPQLSCAGGKPGSGYAAAQVGMTVRRLTPVECERLQGFPDDYTRIAWRKKPAKNCPDGPRYKALGNSMAANVMRWIGRRIEMVEAVIEGLAT